jgi:hypothetical protein
MHNLLSCRKAQFFLLSAFTIITIIFLVSQWIEPYTITDTSSIVMKEEFFIFNNIVEKARETVNLSKDCEELKFNLEEYDSFVEKFALSKHLNLEFNHNIVSCNSNTAQVSFQISLNSTSVQIKKIFTVTKSF